ncbi:hypothetical protein AB4Z21_02295 [Paenibacillus sp. MCAF20]
MAYIVIKGIVSHNGKHFTKGQEVAGLKKEDAERLLELEVIENNKPSKETGKEESEQLSE